MPPFSPTASPLATTSLFLCLSHGVLKNAMPLGYPAGELTSSSERRDKGDKPLSAKICTPYQQLPLGASKAWSQAISAHKHLTRWTHEPDL